MELETQRGARETAGGANPQACPSCGVPLVDGMRFCRSCGYRLGEGMAEYVETVRLDRAADMPGMMQGNQSLTGAPGAQTTMISPPPPAQSLNPRGRRKGRKWLVFLLMFVLLIPVVGIGGRFLFRAMRDAAQQAIGRSQQERDQPRSFLGESEFGDVEGVVGAIFEGAMPDSPAVHAGFLDGDIITKFDGKPVNGEDAMHDVLRETPIGKTVEVVVLRDGETKTLQLTTISTEDYDTDKRLPKEMGVLGVDEMQRVPVEGTKIHGVLLGEVYANRPADLAGLKVGDVVVEFNGKPVRTVEGLEAHIKFAKPASTVPVVVMRNGERATIDVKLGRRR
jgi:membrane-associated protease RseP (regulator of RpoE activity)